MNAAVISNAIGNAYDVSAMENGGVANESVSETDDIGGVSEVETVNERVWLLLQETSLMFHQESGFVFSVLRLTSVVVSIGFCYGFAFAGAVDASLHLHLVLVVIGGAVVRETCSGCDHDLLVFVLVPWP